jgi:hypothetical protein
MLFHITCFLIRLKTQNTMSLLKINFESQQTLFKVIFHIDLVVLLM